MTEILISVTPQLLLAAIAPLFIIAGLSYAMDLHLESSLIVGALRAALQLTICGYLLHPVFFYGSKPKYGWVVVVVYLLFMILMATWESTRRAKYTFRGLSACVLSSLLLNLGWVSIFAFGVLLRPNPLWDPYYTITISGMLLGNCINGVSLSQNALLVGIKEKEFEVELLLAFGATVYEATADIFREALQIGAMPLVNGMMVIGIVSLPGMMTGQILGGSDAIDAARYQILITYLIATCAFGTMLTNLILSRRMCCSIPMQRLLTDKLKLRPETTLYSSAAWNITQTYVQFRNWCHGQMKNQNINTSDILITSQVIDDESQNLLHDYGTSVPDSKLKFSTVKSGERDLPILEMRNISRAFQNNDMNYTFPFRNLSAAVNAGDIVVVDGPSGAGKSQLLRVVAGLSPLHNEDGSDLLLKGRSRKMFPSQTTWRRQIRYVSQYKVDIPGTPKMFLERVAKVQAWRVSSEHSKFDDPPSFHEMIMSASKYVDKWGMDASKCFDKEWKSLSGGESQRVYFAICLASRPLVLLCDESTSALDLASKEKVECSVLDAAASDGMSVLWISHDAHQINRLVK